MAPPGALELSSSSSDSGAASAELQGLLDSDEAELQRVLGSDW